MTVLCISSSVTLKVWFPILEHAPSWVLLDTQILGLISRSSENETVGEELAICFKTSRNTDVPSSLRIIVLHIGLLFHLEHGFLRLPGLLLNLCSSTLNLCGRKKGNNYYYWLLNVEHLHTARDNLRHLCILTCLMLTTTL